jgi:sugar/nucleoside kinase (ribokinase family)
VYDNISQCDHIHIAGYFSLPGIQNEQFLNFIKQLKSAGKTISLDTQDAGLGDWKGKDSNLHKLLELTDIFFPNEYEIQKITNTNSLDSAIAKALMMMPSKSLLVVKLGEKGAAAYSLDRTQNDATNSNVHDFQITSMPAFKVKVVDPTGGGDAFVGAFLYKYLNFDEINQSKQRDFIQHQSIHQRTDIINTKYHPKEAISAALAYGCAAGSFRVSIISASMNAQSNSQLDLIIQHHNNSTHTNVHAKL